ncbi:MAG: hypothetical protein PHS62_03725 [Patescibacteria group bacterium]|nr:hypothetical protein [Patescibacteria group bacterium]
MLDYLKKFNNLPAGLRQKISSQPVMAAIEALEKKYQFPLAALIMKVLVGEIVQENLALILVKENLSEAAAKELARGLNEKVFTAVSGSPAAVVPPKREAARPEAPRSGKEMLRLDHNLPVVLEKSEILPAARSESEPLVKGASFFFSASDEKEIKELASKIDQMGKTKTPAAAIEEKLKSIIDRVQINFGSTNLAVRFKEILKTYLRGIRNRLDTEATLAKSFFSGGLSFDKDSAQQVMDMADKILNSRPGGPLKPLPKIRIKEPENRDMPYDFSKLAVKKNFSPDVAAGGRQVPASAPKYEFKRDAPPARAALRPEMPAPAAVKPRAAKKDIGPLLEIKSFQPKSTARIRLKPESRESARGVPMPFIKRRFEMENTSANPKIKVEDVKYVPKVMSPLDELKYLDLVSFRRLDQNPAKAVAKIMNIINLLSEENYGKRLDGIKFWRSSPLNRLYLKIGQMSISENRPVDVIIEERKIKGGDYLAAAEFEAIMDLNKSLRF